MNAIEEVFKRKRVLLPVIHVIGPNQASRNVDIAMSGGADGVFLINHDVTSSELFDVYTNIKGKDSNSWIGLNFLSEEPHVGALIAAEVRARGIWTDDAGLREDLPDNISRSAYYVWAALQEKKMLLNLWEGLYFGGVAFKYQTPVRDVKSVAESAIKVMDVVTTSGDRTGLAPGIEKIVMMREGIGDHALAIASGISSENVSRYLPLCDCFLVATGISDSHTELNVEKVRALADKIHGY